MRILHHPLGFTTIVLWEGPEGRARALHIWEEPASDNDIHQHRADFTSQVVEGALMEEIFTCEDDPGGAYLRTMADAHFGGDGVCRVTPVAPDVRCGVKVAETLHHKAGETYERRADALHRITVTDPPVVTLVTYGPAYQRVHAIIKAIE